MQERQPCFRSWRIVGGVLSRAALVMGMAGICLLMAIPEPARGADETLHDIDIPQLNAAEALNRLAEQTSAVMLFPYDLAEARQANAVSGRYTLMEALEVLLEGTGLSGGLSDRRVIQITRSETQPKDEDSSMTTSNVTLRKKFTGFIASLFVVTGAAGQDDTANGDDADRLEEIVVTGSRIRRSAADTPTPTTMLDADAIEYSGAVNIFDLLIETPQIGNGSFSSENTSFSFGNAGLNAVALRNLGARRTLTLIDGRRAIGTTDDQNFFAFDSSTVPTEIIDRVEVITGGASAVYGADAVAGVINIIFKDNYEGLTGRVYAGQSGDGDGESYRASLTGGMNFNDNRDNVVFSVERTEQKGLFFRNRDNAGGSVRFIGNPDNTGPDDGIPDQIRATDLRFARFGIPSTTVEFFRNIDGTAANVNNIYSFDQSGQVFLAIPGDELIDGFLTRNEFGGPPGFTDRAIVPLDRTNVFLRWRHDYSDDLTLKATTRLSRVESRDAIGPVFAILSGLDQVSASNPFVPPSLTTILEGDPADPDDDFTNVFFSRQFNDFGPRGVDVERDFYALSLGLEDKFANDWRWDVYGQWGGTDTSNTQLNDRLDARYTQALDAVVDPGSGQIVCRDQSNGCVPLNPFVAPGQIPQNVVDFVTADHTTRNTTRQYLIATNVTGSLFDLPAGPLEFAAGAEYREDLLDFRPSSVWENAEGFFASQFSPVKETTNVTEAYVEFLVPVLRDVPFIEQLDLDAAARIADYKSSGDNTSWKTGLSWRITEDVRIRSVLSRAVRAPSLGELFNPGSRGAQGLTDPCDALNVTANPNRQANCAALGIPPDFVAATRSVTTLVFSTGNETLGVEEADTLTAGIVLTPRFLDNFELTVDYYDIELVDGITRFGAQRTLDLCVDLPTINNNFCSEVDRGPDLNIAEVRDTFINASGFDLRGVDIGAAYEFPFDRWGWPGRFKLGLIASKLSDLKFTEVAADDGADTFENAGETFDPEWRGTVDLTYDYGSFVANWQARYISSQVNNNEDSPEFRDPSQVPSVWYHDVFGSYQITDQFKLSGGLRNVFDKEPPLHPFTASGNNLYPLTGRFFYFQLTYDVF